MRKIRETLGLKFEAGLVDCELATSVGASRSTVQECRRRTREAGLGWPLSDELDEAAPSARLYRLAPAPPLCRCRTTPTSIASQAGAE